MNIVEYKINGGKEVYVIETREGLVLESVVDFIKNKSNSKNCTKETTKIYCEYLKIYLEILDREKHSLDESDVEDLKLFKKELSNCDKLRKIKLRSCLLYTSDAADEEFAV